MGIMTNSKHVTKEFTTPEIRHKKILTPPEENPPMGITTIKNHKIDRLTATERNYKKGLTQIYGPSPTNFERPAEVRH